MDCYNVTLLYSNSHSTQYDFSIAPSTETLNMLKSRWIPPIALALMIPALPAAAQSAGLSAHVHGIAELNLVLEGHDLHLELRSPAMNLVGFEHEPRSKADHEAVEKTAAILKDGDALFALTRSAGCRQESVDVESALLEDGGHHGHDEHHTHHEKHGHEEHHEDRHDEKTHSEFHAEYRFHCEHPERLESLKVNLFQVFPGMEKVSAAVITKKRHSGQSLNAANDTLTIKN